MAFFVASAVLIPMNLFNLVVFLWQKNRQYVVKCMDDLNAFFDDGYLPSNLLDVGVCACVCFYVTCARCTPDASKKLLG